MLIIEERYKCALDENPGFLGLDLPFELATSLLERLTSVGAHGRIAASKYRHPNISLEMAYPIAEEAIKRAQQKYPDVQFKPSQFSREEVMWWEFFSASEKWMQEGYHPGGLVVKVDKVDGHVWRYGEFSRLYGEDRLPSTLRGKFEFLNKRISAFFKIRTLRGKLEVLSGLFREWLSWHLGSD